MEFVVRDFDLRHTLECGQAFRWQRQPDGAYRGVIGRHVVRAAQRNSTLSLDGAPAGTLRDYFQFDANLAAIIATFPADEHMRRAVAWCHGMRLLRQDPWETLASFICSATKQIVQIRQMVANLCRAFGEPVPPGGKSEIRNSKSETEFAFPVVVAVARATEAQLRACKLGFRAKNLLAAARMIDAGEVRLGAVGAMDYPRAAEELMRLPGVGPKIADCALLFGWGRQEAFPLDVWIERALRRLYFRGKRRVTRRRLVEFHRGYFGPHAGYAQQYLFHYVRNNPQELETAGGLSARRPGVWRNSV
ncbi:MAG: 8-oxoguanine DNA glycosylase [Verrucomicrobia bacterium]|nr:8-oxoguanine DNA glycosylase [Verrucomicrobiota bacterium]